MRVATASFLISLLAVSLFAADPAADLAEGRRLIESRNYAQAVTALERARSGTGALAEDQRDDALSVIHFYTALAYFHQGNNTETRSHLNHFLGYTPNARISNRDKYPRRFVDMFENLYDEVNKNVTSFDRYYPGFDARAAAPAGDHSDLAMNLLGSRTEKKEWEARMSGTERSRALAEFWQRRDPTPGTEQNELRDSFLRRVAFADHVFPGETQQRGALTDRGRIFVLLGPPSMVQRRALLKNKDNVKVYFNEQVDGSMELWVYSSEQLPIDIPKRAVQYRFVTQEGIGTGVLQRAEEAYATRVLTAAGEATIRREDGR